MEPPSSDEMRSSGCIIGVRGIQDDESKQLSTPTPERTQSAPSQHVKAPNRVSSRQKKAPAKKSDDFLW